MSTPVNTQMPQIIIGRSERDSTCRACSRSILAGKTRVKIAYAQVVIQYSDRAGTPSFCMHLECFRDRPVDYIKDGVHAWKNWQSIKQFLYRMSQVEGLAEHPEAKVFFSGPVAAGSSTVTTLIQLPNTTRLTSKVDSASTSSAPGHGAVAARASFAMTSQTPSKRGREVLHDSAASDSENSAAKRTCVLVQFKIPSFADILEECQGDRVEADKQFRLHLDLEAKREATYNRAQRALLAADKLVSCEPRLGSKSANESTLQPKPPQPVRARQAQERPVEERTSESDSASDSDSDTAAEEEADEHHSTLQWIKPGQLSGQVGVSISVLRRWANSGAVRTLVSEGGHRLFNVASVVDYIEQQAANSSAVGRGHVSQDDAKGSDVLIFVRLPDRAGVVAKMQEDKTAALSDAHSTSTRMRDAAKLVHQQLQSAFPSSKLIIELPEVPLEEFHHRNSLNRLHTYFTKRQVSKLILGSTQDISKSSVAYKLFEWMCAKHDVTIEVVPNLYMLL